MQGAHAIFFYVFFFFFETLKCARINDTSRVIRNPNILHMRKQRRRCCNRAADQRLCFCYMRSSVAVQPGLCRTWSDTTEYRFWQKICFLMTCFFFFFVFFCTVTTFCLIRNKHLQQNNASLLNTHPYMSRIARNLVFGVSNPVRHKLCCTATEDA